MDYPIHAVIVKKRSVPREEADRIALDILKRKKVPFMRETKGTYRYRHIPKTKFSEFRSKKVNKDITIVFGKLKGSVEGKGVFSNVLNYGIRKLAPKVVSAVVKAQDFNNISTKTLNTFSNYPIKGLKITRTPISNILNTALNLISLGRWNELRKKYGYDTLFHTGLVCDLGGKDIIVEKNEVVNISPEFKISKDTQTYHINMEGKSFTLGEMVSKCKERMGDKLFFDYDAFNNNCQVFIKNMLQSVGLYNNDVNNFLFQDLSEIYKSMPSYVSKITKLITRLGAFVSRLRGDGKQDKLIKKMVINKLKKLTLKPDEVLLAKDLLQRYGDDLEQYVNPNVLKYLELIKIFESSNKDAIRETWNELPVEVQDNFFNLLLNSATKSNIRGALGDLQEEKTEEPDIDPQPASFVISLGDEKKEGEGKRKKKK